MKRNFKKINIEKLHNQNFRTRVEDEFGVGHLGFTAKIRGPSQLVYDRKNNQVWLETSAVVELEGEEETILIPSN